MCRTYQRCHRHRVLNGSEMKWKAAVSIYIHSNHEWHVSWCRGGTEVTVTGDNLDAAAQPIITVTVVVTRFNSTDDDDVDRGQSALRRRRQSRSVSPTTSQTTVTSEVLLMHFINPLQLFLYGPYLHCWRSFTFISLFIPPSFQKKRLLNNDTSSTAKSTSNSSVLC